MATVLSLVTGLFFLVLLLLNQWRSPPLRFLTSDCNAFHIMCDVPGICVFCSASIKSFGGMASKFFHKPFLTLPMAAAITGIMMHLKFYIHCISIHKLLYFSFFSPSFCSTFLSTGIATSISTHTFFLLLLLLLLSLLILLLLLLFLPSFLPSQPLYHTENVAVFCDVIFCVLIHMYHFRWSAASTIRVIESLMIKAAEFPEIFVCF